MRGSRTTPPRRPLGSPTGPSARGSSRSPTRASTRRSESGYVAATRRGRRRGSRFPTRSSEDVPRRARRRCLAADPRAAGTPRRGAPRARRVLRRDGAREFDLDARLAAWCARASTRRVLRETAKLPYGVTATYGEIADRAGNPRASPRRRHRARPQPDPARRPLPPGPARGRRARRLRRRARDEGVPARARGRIV